MKNKEKRGGMEDDPFKGRYVDGCQHPEHEPPRHLHIPVGKRYRHICPGCGDERVIYPSNIRCKAHPTIHDFVCSVSPEKEKPGVLPLETGFHSGDLRPLKG